MLTLSSYPLPTGARSLVLVHVPGVDHPYTLLDIPLVDPLPPDADCRVVADRIDHPSDVYGIAAAHMIRSEWAGAPAVPA